MAQVDLEESMVGQVLAIVIVFPILALVTVILRLFTRFFVLKNPSREDACITFAMVCFDFISETLILTSNSDLVHRDHNYNFLWYVKNCQSQNGILLTPS